MHEFQLFAAGKEIAYHVHGFRPLQREQDAVVGARQHGLARQRLFEDRPVLLLHRAVDDDVQAALRLIAQRPRDDQIVEDAAICVQQHGQARLALFQARNIRRHQRLDQRRNLRMRCVAAANPLFQGQETRAHVRHVEQARMRARPLMLVHHAHRVLHRHFIARERHHFTAMRNMQIVERRAL